MNIEKGLASSHEINNLGPLCSRNLRSPSATSASATLTWNRISLLKRTPLYSIHKLFSFFLCFKIHIGPRVSFTFCIAPNLFLKCTKFHLHKIAFNSIWWLFVFQNFSHVQGCLNIKMRYFTILFFTLVSIIFVSQEISARGLSGGQKTCALIIGAPGSGGRFHIFP